VKKGATSVLSELIMSGGQPTTPKAADGGFRLDGPETRRKGVLGLWNVYCKL
jgi:hypothetical protein